MQLNNKKSYLIVIYWSWITQIGSQSSGEGTSARWPLCMRLRFCPVDIQQSSFYDFIISCLCGTQKISTKYALASVAVVGRTPKQWAISYSLSDRNKGNNCVSYKIWLLNNSLLNNKDAKNTSTTDSHQYR